MEFGAPTKSEGPSTRFLARGHRGPGRGQGAGGRRHWRSGELEPGAGAGGRLRRLGGWGGARVGVGWGGWGGVGGVRGVVGGGWGGGSGAGWGWWGWGWVIFGLWRDLLGWASVQSLLLVGGKGETKMVWRFKGQKALYS